MKAEPKTIKKLMVDITFLQDQYAMRGIGRYGREIFSRIVKQLDSGIVEELHLIGFRSLEENLSHLLNSPTSQLANYPTITFHSLGPARLSRPLSNLWQYYRQIRPLVKQVKPDVYFAVHFDRGLPSDLVPTVVTIHDAIPLATGQFSRRGKLINFLKGLFYKFMWRKVRQAAQVITSSNFSKRDLVNFGDIEPKKIKVIYLGISENFRATSIPTNTKIIYQTLAEHGIKTIVKAGIPRPVPYLFYDAGLEANKNSDKLLQVFAKLTDHYPDLGLVVTGGDFELNKADGKFLAINERSEAFGMQAIELGIASHIIPTGRISEEAMAILLSQALAYINLSGYEGFGFGPVQAMAAGVPAILADQPCFREVSGEAALLVNTDDPLKAAAEMIELLGSQERMQDYVTRGQKLAEKYDWEETFQETWKAIESVGGNRRHQTADDIDHDLGNLEGGRKR